VDRTPYDLQAMPVVSIAWPARHSKHIYRYISVLFVASLNPQAATILPISFASDCKRMHNSVATRCRTSLSGSPDRARQSIFSKCNAKQRRALYQVLIAGLPKHSGGVLQRAELKRCKVQANAVVLVRFHPGLVHRTNAQGCAGFITGRSMMWACRVISLPLRIIVMSMVCPGL